MDNFKNIFKNTDLMLGLALLLIVSMLILPIPHWILDTGLVIAIAISVVVLLTSVNIDDPLKLSIFPSLLLITTLFRLALSITATKLILGSGDGGKVIETFGKFVMGGDFVVGFVAFLILVIVQFIVITNGAGRVSEVVARFTLDGMPGKQMAIDADLAAGIIDEKMAKERRKHIKMEADFYGSMDGASKFVRGDAIASILIIVVNIIGGFAVGFMRGEGDAMTIMKTYTLLSVGEGIVSQIPALLISTSSGLLVTRAGQDNTMGGAVIAQLLAQPRALMSAGIALVLFAFIPGFPTIIFLSIGGALLVLSRYIQTNPMLLELAQSGGKLAEREDEQLEQEEVDPNSPESVLSLLEVDSLEIEVGYGLSRVADPRVGGDLTDRIAGIRKQFASEMGFIVPSVRIRDNVILEANEYSMKVRGEEVARGTAEADMLMALDNGRVSESVPGTPAKDPVFGLDALWIDPKFKDEAMLNGYTIIEPSAMISTHLNEVIKQHAAELLTRQDVQTIIDNVKEKNKAVVSELIPDLVSIGDVQKVLQHLLRERIPIRDMVSILETIADYAPKTKDPDQLGEVIRAAISRTITSQYMNDENKVHCITFAPSLEKQLADAVQTNAFGTSLSIDPTLQQKIIGKIEDAYDRAIGMGYNPILLCNTQLRLALYRLVIRYQARLPVLAFNEVSPRAEVEFINQIKLDD